MRVLIISTVLLAGCQPGYYIYGDSLVSPSFSWANQLSTHFTQVQAMPGLQLIDLTLPAWIGPTPELQGVLLAVGANDAGRGVPVDVFTEHLAALVAQAQAQGLTVTCVEIPRWPDLPQTHEPFEPYRAAQAAECPVLVVIDVNEDVMQDTDGLHWGPMGSAAVARQMEKQL